MSFRFRVFVFYSDYIRSMDIFVICWSNGQLVGSMVVVAAAAIVFDRHSMHSAATLVSSFSFPVSELFTNFLNDSIHDERTGRNVARCSPVVVSAK